MKRYLLSLTVFLGITALFLATHSVSHAAIDSYTLLEPLPCVDGGGQGCEGGVLRTVTLANYIGYLFRLIIALAGAIAIFRITWGGFKYMTTDAITGKKEGKAEIQQAIYGLLMVLASYLILRTIDPRLVNLTTELPPVTQADDVQFDEFFDTINRRNALLTTASDKAKPLRDQAAEKRRQARTYDDNSDEQMRLDAEALKLEQQASLITHNATLDVMAQKIDDVLNSLDASTITTEASKQAYAKVIADLNNHTQQNLNRLSAQNATEEQVILKQRQSEYLKKANDVYIFKQNLADLKKPLTRTYTSANMVARGEAIIRDLNAKIDASQTTIKDSDIRALYGGELRFAITQVEDAISKYKK